MRSLPFFGLLAGLGCVASHGQDATQPPIPIKFHLQEGGNVTLAIDNPEGQRVRNLISEAPYPAGENTVWWDGLDDLGRDPEAARHAIFHIPGRPVAPGKYTVRGLVHPGIDVTYQLTPYNHGNPPWNNGDAASQWLTNHSGPNDVIFLPAGGAPEREGKPTSSGGQVLICSRVAEGGSGLAWVDMAGDKLWGQHWLGGVWTAASHMAVDRGTRPVKGVYAYAAASWPGDKYNQNRAELRLHKLMDAAHRVQAPKDQRFGSGEDRPVLEPTYEVPLISPLPENFKGLPEPAQKRMLSERAANLSGLAVRDGIVWAAFAQLNQAVVIDAHAGKVLGTVPIAGVRGLAFDATGRLYALSQGRLLRFQPDAANPMAVSSPEILVTGLEDPKDLTVDDTGKIYVSDWGTSHQIKRFEADGKALTPIGEPGAPAIGRYNPRHLNEPAGMTVDDQGRLWVAESSHTPKRVSIWNLADGSLQDAFYGPMRYGGSGAVDPLDKTRFFYDDDHGGAMEFKLDYQTGKSVPVSILYLKEEDRIGIEGRYSGGAPSYPIHHGGRTYLTNAFSLHTTGRRSATLWRLDEDGIARIVSAAGNILDSSNQVMPAFQNPEVRARMPAGFVPEASRSLFFVWSDLDGNQRVDPQEVQFALPSDFADPKSTKLSVSSPAIADDLMWTVTTVGDSILQLAPGSVNAAGVPIYDLSRAKVAGRGSSVGGQALTARDGWVITSAPVAPLPRDAVGGVRNGVPIWSYPSLWPSLHASHNAPLPTEPGQLIGTTRVIGNVIDAPAGSDAGQLWAINANKGTIYVFTVDGLFVTRLFQDSRTASWNAPAAKPGMSVAQLSLHEECFGPTWTRTAAGEVLLQCGGPGNIVRVENLEKVRRLPDQTITVTREQLAAALQWNIQSEAARQAAQANPSKPLQVKIEPTPPAVDGKLDDWTDAAWVNIDERTRKVGNWGKRKVTTTASARISGDRLYLAWQTDDPALLRSSGESMNNLFKTGGALDLMIGVDSKADPKRRTPVQGDQRVLITQVKGQTVAVLYAPVSANAPNPPVAFGSPLRTIRFDRVDVISDSVVLAKHSEPDLKKDKAGSIHLACYELSLPLAVLGFTPRPGETYKFDLGLLRGDGQQTLQRVYWTNKASGLVSDIPSEAELTPAVWGELKVEG